MSTNIVGAFLKNAIDNDNSMITTLQNLCTQNKLPATENLEYEIKDKNGKVIGKIRGTLTIDNDVVTSSLQSNNNLKNKDFDVFISYCWGKKPDYENKKRALNIYNELQKNNFKCWLDQIQLIGNEVFGEISEGILKSRLFLCCIDSSYCRSNSTKTEFNFAIFNKKQIKPILFEPLEQMIESIERNSIAIHIPSFLYEKFYSEDNKKKVDDKECLKNLLKSINLLLKDQENIPYDNLFKLNTKKGKAIQLIKIENNVITINPEAENVINKISGPIGVITVVGPSRSGKSYLMNRLLNITDGFKSHANVDACTKGIWFWSGIESHRNDKDEEMNLIIMDTEGLNHVDSSSLMTSKLFLLSILMSSQIIYNTKEIIDEDSLSKLAKMCNLSKIQTIETNAFTSNWPTFIWVLRDFALTHGFKDDNEYLESVLLIKGSDNSEQQNNKRIVSEWFVKSKRHCIALPEPVSDGHGYTTEQKKANLSKLDTSFLRHSFNIFVNELIKLARGIVTAHQNFDSGKTFVEYLNHIVSLLNKGQLINLEALQTSITQSQMNFYVTEIEEFLNQKLRSGPIVPQKLEEYIKLSCESKQKKLENFAKIDFEAINREIKLKFNEKNNKLIETMNENWLFKNWNGIKHRLVSNENRIETVEKFKEEMTKIEDAYYKIAYGTQEQKDKCLQDFYKNIDIRLFEDCIRNASTIPSTQYELRIKYRILEKEVLSSRMQSLGITKLYKINTAYALIFPKHKKLKEFKDYMLKNSKLKEKKFKNYQNLLNKLTMESLPNNLKQCKNNAEFNELIQQSNYHVLDLGINIIKLSPRNVPYTYYFKPS